MPVNSKQLVKKNLLVTLLVLLFAATGLYAQKPKKQLYMPASPVPEKYVVDHRIDNMAYWRRMASLGLIPVAPDYPAPLGKYTGSKLTGKRIVTEDSPDIPVTTKNSTQSENSIFVDPANPARLLNSNNSTPKPVSHLYGANDFMSNDKGNSWTGEVEGAGGENGGDPSTAIGLNGWYYVGYIHASGGQGISYSTDKGNSWTPVLVAPAPPGFGSLLDKNHMWIDNSLNSPHEGILYDAWTNFKGNNDKEIEFVRSTDQGLTWSTPKNISSNVNAGAHNHGVNIHTGPNGEVYAVWAIYDVFPGDEKALGMAKSMDGGVTWQPATRIIQNIKGIRKSATSKAMRVNSFPSMAVDNSDGPNRGAIYITWPNNGKPGINTGNGIDIYMIKSVDGGTTWAEPIKVNQDAPGLGKQHYFSWITCDATNGILSVIYYDDRNVGSKELEVYVSTSRDGGATWEDMKVSDVSFTPKPIQGLGADYFGDYLGIHSHGGWVYPVWTDNRTGYAMSYVSPFRSAPPPNQAWIAYKSHVVNDEMGNNNGLLDFGETLKLDIIMENAGDQPTSVVTTRLSTHSPYITINDGTENLGDFDVAEIKNFPGAFQITVATDVPDGEIIILTLTSTDASDSTFVSNFKIEAHAPALEAGEITINDEAGNNNGRLDPGETAILSIQTLNPGDYTANDVIGRLTTASPFLSISTPEVQLGSLESGATKTATFELVIDPSTPIGYPANLNYTVTSTNASINKTYTVDIGLIIEDWETGGDAFDWQFAGTTPWAVTINEAFEGTHSAASGAIGDNQTSEMSLAYEVMNSDSISFYIKTSSEKDHDFLKFYINNTLRGQWSGEVNWQQVKFLAPAGNRVFKWTYSKDASTSSGSDKAWVDYIVFPSPLQTYAFAGPDAGTCGTDAFLTVGVASNYNSTLWTTSGDGTFENASQLSTFYAPGTLDMASGSVKLKLTANGPAGEIMSDEMTLTIGKQATIFAGAPVSICEGKNVQLNGVGENYLSIKWTTSGDGNFSNTAILNPVYTPGAQDLNSGIVELMITATSTAPCSDAKSIKKVTILPGPTLSITGNTSVCYNHVASLTAQTEEQVQYLWTPGNYTSQSINVDTTGIGSGSHTWTLLVTNQYGCTSTESITVNFYDCTGIDKPGFASTEIYPNPSDGAFTIRFAKTPAKSISLNIVDAAGNEVYSLGEANPGNKELKVRVPGLKPGIYMVNLVENNKSSILRLIIK